MNKSEGQIPDFEKICRLCLLEKRSMSSIFSKKKSDKKVPLPVRIMSCASLELYEGDGLPASICSKCLLSVNQSYAFREQCEQADTTLRQYVQRMNEASGETSSNRESRERLGKGSLDRIEDCRNKVVDARVSGLRNKQRISLDGNGIVPVFSKDMVLHPKKRKKIILTQRDDSKSEMQYECSEKSRETDIREEKKESSDVKADYRKLPKKNESFESFFVENSETQDVSINKMKLRSDSTTKETYHSPVLNILGGEKIENLIVSSEVTTVLEDRDSDFEDLSSKNADWAKTTSRNSHHQECDVKKYLFPSQLFVEGKSSNFSRIKKSFGNKKHPEPPNLSKNKNIDVEEISPVDCNSKKKSVLKCQDLSEVLCEKKSISLLGDVKVAQLWRDSDEVDKKSPKVFEKPVGKQQEVQEVENETFDSRYVCLTPDTASFNKIAPEESAEEQSGSKPRTKWKNARDTVYCKDCEIFLKRSSYNNHIKFVHKKIRKYLCQTCGYAAYTGTILRQHVQAVHVGYSFFCDQCPKKFNLMKRLRKHVELQHSGKPVERNQICQYCGMAFSKPGCLKRHLRSHTQETPYHCQYCQRRFKYRWPKVQHERLHTGEKPYKCSFCEERFTQNCVRKAHEYKKHGNEEFKPKGRVKKKSTKTRGVGTEKENSEASSPV